MSKLFIAEKPSLGRAIAEGIGVVGKKPGYIECKNGDVVTWGFGHLLELAEAHHYNPEFKRWNFNNLPIIPDELVKLVRDDAGVKKQVSIIRGLHKKCTSVVNAGDPDREGQLLIDELLDEIGNKKPVERIWLAALDLKSTRKALESMKSNKEYYNLRMAAEARSTCDWLVGINLTRAATLTLSAQGGHNPLSIGRVQTPTLALVVNRELEIRNFKSRDYFSCIAQLSAQNVTFKADFKPEYNDNLGGDPEGYLVDKGVADKALKDIESSAVVVSFDSKKSQSNQPVCYALSTLQVEASSKIGLGAKQTLDVAQKLYENGFTSYPRTDCGFLPEEQHSDAKEILANIATIIPEVNGSDASIKSPTWNNKKVTAHHGIIPTTTKPSGLSDDEMSVYRLICKRYVAQFYGAEIYDSIKVKIEDASGHIWMSTGKNVHDDGWRKVYGGQAEKDSIPNLSKGDKLAFKEASSSASKTKPPARFTEGSLIKAMSSVHNFVTDPKIKKLLRENSGIGTEATRAGVIETLFKRTYMKTVKKQIIPSDLGVFLVQALSPRLVDPGVTAVWEEYLKKIEQGELTFEEFVGQQKKFIPKWIDDIKEIDFPESIVKQFPKKEFTKKPTKKKAYKKA